MSKISQFFVLAVAVVVLSGCFPVSTRVQVDRPANVEAPTIASTEKVAAMVTQTPTPAATETSAPTATAAIEQPTPTAPSLSGLGIANTTFTDTYAGFAFEYPSDWAMTTLDLAIAQNSSVYTHSMRSPMPTRGPKQQEGIPPGASAIDVVIINEGEKTLEDAVAARKQAYATEEMPPTIIAEEAWVLPSGLKAVRFLLDTRSGQVANMITVINGREILFAGMGELALFEPIAKSLRPIE